MRILALDDEKIALEGLVKSIREAEPTAEVLGFKKASEAMEYFQHNPCDIVFLDIQMRSVNGVTLAKEMKLLHPQVNIIFATGYSDYLEAAFAMHASGYLIKPITTKKVRAELDDLRHPVEPVSGKRVTIYTFGNFEVYVDGKPLLFKYERTKEMLAYLVDRQGAFCSNAEIMSALWEDERRTSYLGNLKKDLLDTLREKNCESIVETGWNKLRIEPEQVECDYFAWMEGSPLGINRYRGEYMSQYSWAEFTNARIFEEQQQLHKNE